MLEQLKKVLGSKDKEQLASTAHAVVAESEQPNMEKFMPVEQFDAVATALAAQEEIVSQLTSQLAEMTGKLASLQQYADEAEAKAAAIAAEAKAKEVADKKAQLADVIGADNPAFDTTWQAVESLDVNSFNVVVSGFKAALAKEAESMFFKEVGVDGEADLSKTSEESREMALLKAKYQSK